MRNCAECRIEVEGTWTECPLCGESLTGEGAASPLPDVPLTFSRRKVYRVLFLVSLAVVGLSFAAQLLLGQRDPDLGVLRFIWMGVVTMWLVASMAIRKRHNVAKGILYLVVLVGLCCVYWDYLTGWHAWSLTWVVPIVCGSAVVALLITTQVMRTEVGDHILYSGLTVLLGLAPMAFLAFGWVTNPLPSGICGLVSLLTLVLLQVARGADVRHELAKRLHL